MKKLSILPVFFVCLLLLSPRSSFAVGDFSGHWLADSGDLVSNVGISAKCSKVEIWIEQTAQTVLTKNYLADCGLYGSHWGPVPQDYSYGKVFEAGEEVGTIDDSTLMTTSQSGTAKYAYNLKLVSGPNGEPLLKTYYGAQTGIGALVTEATLKKVSATAMERKP